MKRREFALRWDYEIVVTATFSENWITCWVNFVRCGRLQQGLLPEVLLPTTTAFKSLCILLQFDETAGCITIFIFTEHDCCVFFVAYRRSSVAITACFLTNQLVFSWAVSISWCAEAFASVGERKFSRLFATSNCVQNKIFLMELKFAYGLWMWKHDGFFWWYLTTTSHVFHADSIKLL